MTALAIVTVRDFGTALRIGRYASGGYPTYFVTADGCALSFADAWDERHQIVDALNGRTSEKQWRVTHLAINWGATELRSDHSGARIESAYAEDQADEEPQDAPPSYCAWLLRVHAPRTR